jgi:Flp pilus assembly protein TadD
MGDLATYYAKKGDIAHATEFIERARTIDKKDVELIHTQAMVENLAGKPADAVRTLREALANGYPLKEIEEDSELQNLKDRPDFQALVKEYSGKH